MSDSYKPRRATSAAIRLAGRLLAEDVRHVNDWMSSSTLATGRQILHEIDVFDIAENEDHDRAISALAAAEPLVWLELAEDGSLDGTHYIAHVLYHHGIGGHQWGEAWIGHLLQMIAAMPAERRTEEANCHPEYVGLHRVVTEIPDGGDRLLAVLDRR